MQSVLEDFEPEDYSAGWTPCPYCGALVAAVTHTLASGNLLSKPLHLGPVADCPAFDHWTFELPWWC